MRNVLLASTLVLLAATAAGAADGAAVFKARCASCHGETGMADTAVGKALKAPALAGDAKVASMSDADLQAKITDNAKHKAFIKKLGADDVAGPVTLAVAGRPRTASAPAAPAEGEAPAAPPEPRLVVFGDSDFAANQGIEAYRNRDLFVNSVNWLLGDVEAIAVRPNQSRASRLMLSNEQISSIRYVALFVLPQAIAIVGVLAWWSRRRAPGR